MSDVRKRPKIIPREKSLLMPDIRNPFVHELSLSWVEKLKVGVMSVTVAPIRAVIITVLLFVTWCFARAAITGRGKDAESQPFTGWRKALNGVMCFLGRSMFFFSGFQYVTIKGRRAPVTEAPILVAAPHSTMFDAIVMFACGLPSGVSKSENANVPVVGSLIKYTQPILVSREDPNSRQNTIKEMIQRAESKGKWPQTIIFPEGTCTNRSCLIGFKPGGFYPGVPVQPICIKYKNKLDTATWTWQGPSALTVLWLSLCQFHCYMEIEFLPVYRPSEEERKDAKLYSRNVRDVMARALDLPVTDHTFEDCRLMSYATQLDLPAAAGLVEFQKLSRKLGLTMDNMKELLAKFKGIAQQTSGFVTVDEFAQYLEMPVTGPLLELFDLYDRDSSGSIDFREFVIGFSLLARPANSESTINLAFQLFDHGNKGHITELEFADILQQALGMSEVDVHTLFTQVDLDSDGKITFDEFKTFANEKPEYAKLFTTYKEMMQANPDWNDDSEKRKVV